MSAAAIKWALEQRASDNKAKQVLLLLAIWHNPKTGQCNPGIGVIADELQLSRRSVVRALKDLRQDGLIIRLRPDRNENNLYILSLDGGKGGEA